MADIVHEGRGGVEERKNTRTMVDTGQGTSIKGGNKPLLLL